MTSGEDIVTSAAQQMLRLRQPNGPYERSEIETVVDEMLRAFQTLGLVPEARERIVSEIETRMAVTIGRATTLIDPTGHQDWYFGDRKQGRRFFRRYRDFLDQELRWPSAAVTAIDETTDIVMELLEDPLRPGPWDRRGLVVGHVQSGKTANYAGLIAKAADAGYKLIIVLAGMHNALRGQTQARLDRDFLGYDTSRVKRGQVPLPIGVGAIDGSCHAEYLTTKTSDFRRSIADQTGTGVQQRPLLLVVKKNASILRNLNSWVTEILAPRGDTSSAPLLVIDDEADQASVDTGDPELDGDGVPAEDYDPSRINGEIRRLLKAFDRSAYVGYTATPFANILIHDEAIARKYGEDLFPRSFIVNLPTPSDYIGPGVVFGIDADEDGEVDDPLPLIRSLDQDGEGWIPASHKKEFKPRYQGEDRLPPSLETALKTFVVACAARAARGQSRKHSSMLIHVSRFKDVHQRVYDQVDEWLTEAKRVLRYGVGRDRLTAELRDLWTADFEPTSDAIRQHAIGASLPNTTWEAVDACLLEAVEKIKPLVVNSASPTAIDYEGNEDNGLSVIAIGGDKLSRGLTLEGLTVSYFLRPSKMYDSLMQMGRWFGYRPGYIDLCRLFVTPDLQLWFRHVAGAAEELRSRIDTMSRLGATPEQYGLRIKSHEIMAVTASNKMRHSREFQVSFAGEGKIQTIFFSGRDENLANATQVIQFLNSLGDSNSASKANARSSGSARIWSGVDGLSVASFVSRLTFPEEARDLVADRLATYIREQIAIGELTTWTVAVLAGDGEVLPFEGWSFTTIERKPRSSPRSDRYIIGTLLSPRDEALDLTPEEFTWALDATNRKRDKIKKEHKSNPDGPEIREARGRDPRRGLLLIYPLSPKKAGVGFDFPIFGVVISFPDSDKARSVRYRFNTVELRVDDE
ncbi:Z1 domain-containing protein [Microvirga soli]|uniref:Z1 domain-containing protein n=1 Tax=Microvirga soli TaxID=1854496 RepID=UPI00191DCEB3|nr:Z1 domain-containing protein [Microvirga soli]